jgi:class 3 adenylate cyclase/pimeloyl-ACP methyl ester carboxylesterase
VVPEIRYARNGEVSIAYQVVGEGPVDLVFVPGFVSNLEVAWEDRWLRQPFERLASFSRLILFDKREQGLSDRVGRAPTLEETMEDLRAVLDAAGSERAAVLGTSEGGPMALLLAATYPERVSRLILYGTYARLTRAPDYPDGFPPSVYDAWRRIIHDEWAHAPAMRLLAPSLVGDADAERAWTRFIRMGTSPSGAAALIELYRDIDVRDVLPVVGVPTLVLHRRDDSAVRPALGRYMAKGIPGARFVETPGRDHAFFVGGADAEIGEIEEFVTGGRQARIPQRVLSTVLFTDIVDSTQRAADLGDRRWRALLDRHDELVRKQIERHDGQAVKSTGDGVLATFSGPARGISCARTIADEIGDLGIEVRAGLHTGECELRDGDIGGMAVHIGARVASQAKPGEVLVSRTVKDLVVGSGIEFEDRGDATLKGVPGDWRLYAVAG